MTIQEPTQEELRQFVQREVIYCQSMLVDELIGNETFSLEDVENISYTACSDCGGIVREATQEECEKHDLPFQETFICDSCDFTYGEGAYEELNTEHQEIFEWYICSDWLADRLQEKGEPMLRNDWGVWWGRTCTGQAILLDSVIKTIYKELHA